MLVLFPSILICLSAKSSAYLGAKSFGRTVPGWLWRLMSSFDLFWHLSFPLHFVRGFALLHPLWRVQAVSLLSSGDATWVRRTPEFHGFAPFFGVEVARGDFIFHVSYLHVGAIERIFGGRAIWPSLRPSSIRILSLRVRWPFAIFHTISYTVPCG